ncbi:MAG TPA: SEC-C domain-containing protein [Smithella sp.]|jgi:hypothetical protein|nr:SEC-C domain-containing protein [Smithella sp.]HOX99539.1 SEC-C domain-containing protein [Smithella sp.]HPL48805.1 SEC-C domain-containing protein [Smithella sp.]HPN87346.1 SEC-C domain-containing protein [Smithella sp.]
MKRKLTGEMLDDGQCICGICGGKDKMGGVLNPMSQQPTVACYHCMIKMSAEAKGITVAEAERRKNEMMRVTHLFIKMKMDEYAVATGRDELPPLDEANHVLSYIMNVWNTFSKDEKEALEKEADLAPLFQSVAMNWQYLSAESKQRRNELCPCGSGKKYKACCLAKEENEKAEVEKYKKIDTWVIRKAMKLISELTDNKTLNFVKLLEFYFGARRLADARKYGMTQKDVEEFHEWLMNDYYFNDEQTPFILAELVASGTLSNHEEQLVNARIGAPKSVYMVTFIKKGTGALLRNVFDKKEVFVHDIGFSQSTREGMAVFVRIFPAGGYHLLSGGHMAYPANILDGKLKTITKAYKKSRRKDDINNFLRKNGHIFSKLF